ncbi:MAG: response regulator [Planctomycetia bacterium]|nr:response regulator [Planctomycetia bacterium]
MTSSHCEDVALSIEPGVPGPGQPRRPGVLIVDDEAGIRSLLTLYLAEQGFSVWEAATGAQAVAVLDSQRTHIDLVLLDVVMPGLDGPQTLDRLRAIVPDIRCCFMSGYLGTHTSKALLAGGAFAVFEKPLQLATLAGELHRLIGVG